MSKRDLYSGTKFSPVPTKFNDALGRFLHKRIVTNLVFAHCAIDVDTLMERESLDDKRSHTVLFVSSNGKPPFAERWKSSHRKGEKPPKTEITFMQPVSFCFFL